MKKLLIIPLLLSIFSCSQDDMKLLYFSLGSIEMNGFQDSAQQIPRSESVLSDDNFFVWGGSVVEGEDGRYHMFYSVFDAGPDKPKFSDAWLLSSKIAYAVSDFPDRGFNFKKIVLRGASADGNPDAWDAQGVHNPHIKKFNGKYYLYYIGSRDPGERPEGDPGYGLNQRNRIQQVQKMAVIEFDSIDDILNGNFERPKEPLLAARTRVKPSDVIDPSPIGTVALPDNLIVVNPSVEYRPSDGKYLLYFKGNLYDPGWRGAHGLALSGSPTGPFEPLNDFMFDLRTADGRIASAEDPYVWYHPDSERFYAVFKDFSGTFTGENPGLAMMISSDGIRWELHPQRLFAPKEIPLVDAPPMKVANLERPQFLINDRGEPIAMYAACSISGCGPKTDGSTFNIQFKVKLSE
jgi:predicted GH43/DUF377 family glycosyl hydrolase